MEKFKEKRRLFKYFSFIVLVLCLSVGLVFGSTKNISAESETQAAVYANAEYVLKPLIDDTTSVDSSYDISEIYPILPENQTFSDLCWVYSTMKSLETTLMKATDEYYNFSETALALMAYLNGTNLAISTGGNFETFNVIAQKYGLVYESEFSNDKFSDVSEDNSANYEYVLDLASKDAINSVLPVTFANSNSYYSSTISAKADVVKKFVQRYGGVFVGLKKGTIYKQSTGGYMFTEEVNKYVEDGAYFESGHAVCVVGWDDNGFIALNSWGIETTSCTYFYIPYDYEYMYYQTYGYYYVGGETITLSSSNASTFSTSVLKSDVVTKNMFGYNESLNLKYSLSSSSNVNFSSVYVQIFKGTEDVTQKFIINFKDTENSIQIISNFDSTFFAGGTYVVRVYEDVNLLGVKNFSVVAGTEVAYFKLVKNDTSGTVDSYSLLSGVSTSETVSTFYISSSTSYILNFYLTEFNKYSKSNVSPTITVGNVYIYSTSGGTIMKQSSSLNLTLTGRSDIFNRYQIKLSGLNSYAGSRIEFDVTIASTLYSATQTYKINLLMSNLSSVGTSYANSIEYILDGGQNSNLNVSKFPLYDKEKSMTNIHLYSPVKNGYTFVGWYLDSDFTTEISQITSANLSDLVVYAKWEKQETTYFESAIELAEVLSYSGTLTKYSKDYVIVYGDTVYLDYTFTELDALAGYNYSLKYYLFINGDEYLSESLDKGTQTKRFTLAFPDLVAGNFRIYILTAVVISHSASAENGNEISFSVSKKFVNFAFDNSKLQKEYNGESYNPTSLGAVTFDGVYNEDINSFSYTFSLTSKSDFGSYNFYISTVSNNNYDFDKNVYGTLVISQKVLTVSWSNLKVAYNGQSQSVGYQLVGIISGDSASLVLANGAQKDVGVYNVSISGVSNTNYIVNQNTETTFEITPSVLVITFENVSERLQTAPIYRKTISYKLTSGTIYGDDDINVVVECEGLTATKSGKYKISGTASNQNYEVYVNDAVYTLTGYYYVYYTLPNGEIYTEIVADGENPKGITSDIYEKPSFSGYTYSQKLENIGEDLYITVTITNYFWLFLLIVVGVGFGGIYLFITRKQRRNKVK
jgi:uncharacterized repeat protein (TIGR02543 family)